MNKWKTKAAELKAAYDKQKGDQPVEKRKRSVSKKDKSPKKEKQTKAKKSNKA